jgi:hypothetical protein
MRVARDAMITALGLLLTIDTVGGGIRMSVGVSAQVGDKAKSSISEGALELGHGPSFKLSAYHVHIQLLLATNPDPQIEMSNSLRFHSLSKWAIY